MGLDFIVVGDHTSHGGTVITGDLTSDIEGKPMARVGDMVVCPKCKGIFRIKTGADNMVDGASRAYARDGDLTDCGAILIASQRLTNWSSESDLRDSSPGAEAAQSAPNSSPGLCLDCLIKAAMSGSAVVPRE